MSYGRPGWVTERALIAKAALRKLPATADDGTPYCMECRRYGELHRMVASGVTKYSECEGELPPDLGHLKLGS